MSVSSDVNTSCALGRLSKQAKCTGLGYSRAAISSSMYSRTMIELPHSSSAMFALPAALPFGFLRIHGASTGKCEGKQAARRGARRRAGHGTDHGWAEEQGLRRSIILCWWGLKASAKRTPSEPQSLAKSVCMCEMSILCPNSGKKKSVTYDPPSSAVGSARPTSPPSLGICSMGPSYTEVMGLAVNSGGWWWPMAWSLTGRRQAWRSYRRTL